MNLNYLTFRYNRRTFINFFSVLTSEKTKYLQILSKDFKNRTPQERGNKAFQGNHEYFVAEKNHHREVSSPA